MIAKALRNSEEEEYQHLVGKCLKNECGLLVTNSSEDDGLEYFNNLPEPDFAMSGGLRKNGTPWVEKGVELCV